MSLSITLKNAISGLQTTQSAIQVTSNNVTNASTEGYTRKVVDREAVSLGGVGAGVQIAAIRRNVDDYLSKELRNSSGDLGGLSVQDEYHDRMQDMFGLPSSNSSVAAYIGDFEAKLQALAANPESTGNRLAVIQAGQLVAGQLNSMSGSVQDLRLQADREIQDALDTVNRQLEIVADLNGKIARARALGQSTADAEDQRDNALDKIAEQMDISYFTRSNGEVVVFTPGGRTLLDGGAQPLSHTPVSSMNSGFSYPGTVDGIDLSGTDITNEIRSGRLAALIEMRDRTLPAITDETHRLATVLRDEVNRIHNDGSGVPAASTLTSSRAQTGTAVSLTGTVRVALLNADGTQAFSAVVAAPPTLDAAGFAASINAALGGFGGSSASNAGGIVSLNGGAYGIVLSGGTVDPGAGAPTTSVSDFLHLNDFFVGNDTVGTDYAAVIEVRSDIVQTPTRLSAGVLRQDPATATYYVSPGDNIIAQRLADKFNETLTFATAGALPQLGTTLSGYGTSILSKTASDYSSLQDVMSAREAIVAELRYRATSTSGVNVDEELANLVVLQNAYAASARLVTAASDMMEVLNRLGE